MGLGGEGRTNTFRKAHVSSREDRGCRVRFQAGHPFPGCETLNLRVSEPHQPPVTLSKVVGASLMGDSNERMDEEHQHPAGGRGRRSVSRLSSLSFKVCPSPPSGSPRPPPMTSLGSLPKRCPTVHSRLNANKTPSQQHSPLSQGRRVAPWVPHLPRVGRQERRKKEKVNPGGLLESLSYKKAKG